jgi:transcriptional regulator with XRE-family HTH domain
LRRRSIRLREIHRLSQRQAAARIGIAASTLSRIERGLLDDLSVKILSCFCRAYDVTPDYLLGYDRFWPAKGKCLKCGGSVDGEPHTPRECIMDMHDQGRKSSHIAKEFDLTLKSVEFIVSEEYRIRSKKASSASR